MRPSPEAALPDMSPKSPHFGYFSGGLGFHPKSLPVAGTAKRRQRVRDFSGRLLRTTDFSGGADFSATCQAKPMTLSAVEFTRRFLLHVLPRGFVKIRHYGFLANRCRGGKLALCKRLLGERPGRMAPSGRPAESEVEQGQGPETCQVCRAGRMMVVRWLEPGGAVFVGSRMPTLRLDSS